MQLKQAIYKKVTEFKSMVILLIACLLSLVSSAGTVADSVLTIDAGRGIRVVYALQQGTYDIVVHGEPVLRKAVAVYKGQKEMESTALSYVLYKVQPVKDAFGKGIVYTVERSGDNIRMQQLFYVYPGKSYFFIQVKMTAPRVAASYLSPLTTNELLMDQNAEARGLVVPFDNDMWVRYEVQPLDSADYTASEVTSFFDQGSKLGWVIGSVEHKIWKSGIKVKHAGNGLTMAAFGGFSDPAVTHDKLPHGKVVSGDTNCYSPKIFLGLYDDWRDGMEEYAAANKLAEPPVVFKWKKATPMGWNSWGALQTKLDLQSAKAVVDFFSDSCKGFRNADGTLFIDLDSYWDKLIKGGIDGDVSQLQSFVSYCKSKKLQPGIYWAPFADWGKQDVNIANTAYKYSGGWTRQNGKPVDLDGAYALDPTHPGTRARIVQHISRFRELGFEMIKIDFLGHAALESDRFYDASITTGMQAYAAGMEFLDSVLDNSMLLYAAISPTMATGRYVHMRRIACDAFSSMDNTEYTLNSTGYGWWQSHLYRFADADHVVFNNEPAGVNRARLASALVTGTLITGDDFSSDGPWKNTARKLLQNKALLRVIKDGQSFRPLAIAEGRKSPALFIKTLKGKTYLAAFNYTGTVLHLQFSPEELGFGPGNKVKATEIFTQATMQLTASLSMQIPPNDVRLYEICVARNQ